jgi:hypothetical protein
MVMAYEVKERSGKFYVVDTETQKIRGTYDNEDAADDRKEDLEFRVHVKERLNRMPVSQMTAEEKAAEYDKLMAAKQTDPNLPPKKDPADKTDPPKPKRSAYWGDRLDEN